MLASNHLIGFGAASDAGVWTSVFSNSPGTDNAGYISYTVVQFIPQASISATGGTQVRLTLKNPASVGHVIGAMYIGQASAGYTATSPAFAATPTQITFAGGASGYTVGAGAGDTLSDAVSFVMPSSNGLAIAWQYSATASTLVTSASGTPSGGKVSYKNASDASTVAKSGYTDFSASAGGGNVKLVEELI